MGLHTKFKLELTELIEKFELPKSVGLPSIILAEHVIRSLSNLLETERDGRQYFANEVNASELLKDPPAPQEKKTEGPRVYMVFAATRALACEWAVQNGVADWVYPGTIRGVKAMFASREPHRYEIKIIGNGWGEDLQIKEALAYAQLTLGVSES